MAEQKKQLDAAFLADMKRLATPEGTVKFSDLEAGKGVYDKMYAELDETAENIRRACEAQMRTLAAVSELISKARELVEAQERFGQEASWYGRWLKELFEKPPPAGYSKTSASEN